MAAPKQHPIGCANVHHRQRKNARAGNAAALAKMRDTVGTVTLPADADAYTVAMATSGYVCEGCADDWRAARGTNPTVTPELV